MISLIDSNLSMKLCSRCKNIRSKEHFHKDKNSPTGLAYYCKDCANEKARLLHNSRKNNNQYKQLKKNGYIKNRYGLTLQQYTEKLELQKVCSICGVKLSHNDTNVHLDHCHKTGKVRDFLCGNCNRGIGSFHDEIWKLEKAIHYLKSHNSSEDTVKEVIVNDRSH